MGRNKKSAQKSTIAIIDPAIQRVSGHRFTSLEMLQNAFSDHDTTFYINTHSSVDMGDRLGKVCFWFQLDPYYLTSLRGRKSARPVPQ